jgi:hypothetical protein
MDMAERAAAAITACGRCRERDLMEKRENNRHDSDTAVRCSFLTTLHCAEPIDGIMKNYGSGGMYAELRYRFTNGTILVVRSTGSASGCPSRNGYRSMSLAEVKWSVPLPVQGDICYGTGLKYLLL